MADKSAYRSSGLAFVPSRYGKRYAYGHVIERERHLIVSGGLGTSIIPCAFRRAAGNRSRYAWRMIRKSGNRFCEKIGSTKKVRLERQSIPI